MHASTIGKPVRPAHQRREARLVEVVLANAVVCARLVHELERRLILQLLHEVIVPVQSRAKRSERTRPAWIDVTPLGANRLELGLACEGALKDLAHRDRAEGEIR